MSESPDRSPDVALVQSLHAFATHAGLAIRAAEAWMEAGRPLSELSEVPADGLAFFEMLSLAKRVAAERDHGGPVIVAVDDIDRAVRPIAARYFPDQQGDVDELLPVVASQIQAVLSMAFVPLDDGPVPETAIEGLATHWAELYSAALVDLNLAEEPDEWEPNPSLAAGATDILHQVFRWSLAGRPASLRIEDEQCANWLATNFEAALSGTPWAETYTVPVDVAALLLLTDPMDVVLQADPTAPPTSSSHA